LLEKIELSKLGAAHIGIYFKPTHTATMERVYFKLDTGADVSTISKVDLDELGYDNEWIKANVLVEDRHIITTASGDVVRAGTVRLPMINILGLEAKNWPFTILLDEDKNFRNLLGRDLMTGFNYKFNNDDKVLEIERAKVFSYIRPPLAGQEINVVENRS